MILKLARDQEAQTLPYIAGVILLVVALLMASLAISSLSIEGTNQQAAADSAALAGANVLAKSTQTIEVINFIIWLRNIVLDVLYAVVTIADIASLGSATGLYEIPANFQAATGPAIDGLYAAKEAVKEIAPVYAVGNSIAYIQANNTNGYYGLAVPFPIEFNAPPPTAAERSLKGRIEERNRDIGRAREKMDNVWIEYYKRKNYLKSQGLSADEIKRDEKVIELLQSGREISGRVGGLTSSRNKWSKELAALEAKRGKYFRAGQDGLVAIVVHQSTSVPYSAWLGGQDTGFNVAIAAAKAQKGRAGVVVGQSALRNLFAGTPVLKQLSGALTWLLDALNIFGRNTESLGEKYGVVGRYFVKALKKLNLVPPEITETRPVLTNTKAVTRNTIDSQLGGLVGKVKKMLNTIHTIENKYGKKSIPDGFQL